MGYESINATCKPEFEGQLVKYASSANQTVVLLDEARLNAKYGNLEWWAVPSDHKDFSQKMAQAKWPRMFA
jgi:hypothetical protein